MKWFVFVLVSLAGICNAQEPEPGSQQRDALSSIESTRGGRHWVDEKSQPPKPPDESLKCFEVEPGLRVELVAAEPLVMDPVSIAFDEKGIMFVAEYGDYPTGPPNKDDPPLSRIVILIDEDHDRRMDRRHVFADQLDFAHSMMPFRGGLLVCSQNEISFYKDTNGDYQADVKEVYFKGFTPAHSQMQIGNPRWGLDNWIYFNQGPGKIQRMVRGGDLPGDAGKSLDSDSSVLDMPRKEFRFHPVTMQFGPASGLGQFGNTIDNFGNRFFSTNRNPIMAAPILYEQLRRNPFVVIPKDHYDVAPSGGASIVFPLVKMKSNYLSHAGTHTSACGTTAYIGDLLGEKYFNSVFVCEPIGHLVTRSIIKPSGVTLIADRARPNADFLASTDTWFRPASLATGPNGALYVADMYRLLVEHPKFVPPEIAKRLDWRAGDDRGRIWRIVLDETTSVNTPFVAPESTDDLVKLLSDPSGWRRRLAQRLLVEQQAADAAPKLRQLIRTGETPLTRLHALWTLDGLGELTASDLGIALADSDVYVRRDAVSLAAVRLGQSPTIFDQLANMAEDGKQRVRFEVALALGETDDPKAIDVLAYLAMRDGSEPWFATAILTSVKNRAGAVLNGLARMDSLYSSLEKDKSLLSSKHKNLVRELSSVVGTRGDLHELKLVFETFADSEKAVPWWQAEILNGLAIGLSRHRGKLGRTSLAKLLANPPDSLATCVAPVVALLNRIPTIAVDSDHSIEDRVATIDLLAYRPFASSTKVFEQLLDIGQPVGVQLACLNAMRNGGPNAGELVLDQWSTLGPRVRPRALALLFRRVDTTVQTLEAMQAEKISPAIVSIDRRVLLLKHKDPVIKSLAAKLFGGAVSPNRREVARQYSTALTMKASAARGQKVFEQSCSKCHRKDGLGHPVGPDISDVRNRSREALLHDILDPNQKIEPKFTAYLVQTMDGRFFNGLMATETPSTVVLQLAENQQQIIARDEIEDIRASGKSLMPEGIEKELTVQQMADLLEFLTVRSPTVANSTIQIPDRPNIVLIVCDNLGYADIEPFGSELHRTPHLNRLAKDGMKFTHFYSASGVCTPSRAAIMTGCYPKRVSMDVTDGAVLRPVSQIGLHPDEFTVAEMLKTGGYKTAAFGKWHLGDQPEFLPTQQGFDTYVGIPYSDDMTPRDGTNWPPLPLVVDEQVLEAPTDRDLLTKRLTEKAVGWIESNADKPFFLYFPQCMPGSTRTPFASPAFKGKSKNGPWGDSVEELDWSVGEIVAALERMNLNDNTLIIWTSDNGAPRRNPKQGLNRPLGGWGYSTAEGGMRVPCIMKWPGRIAANSQCDELATLMDVLPTFAALASIDISDHQPLDGHNIRSLMTDESSSSPYERFLYFRTNQLQAVRSENWKWYLPTNKAKGRLYDVVLDPGETTDLESQHANVVQRLSELAAAAEADLGQGKQMGPGCRPAGKVAKPTPLLLWRDQ